VATIAGRLTAGDNITVTGLGTAGSPFVVSGNDALLGWFA